MSDTNQYKRDDDAAIECAAREHWSRIHPSPFPTDGRKYLVRERYLTAMRAAIDAYLAKRNEDGHG